MVFQKVGAVKPKRSAFNLSHERKFSMNFGELVPIMCQEVVPGDTFKNNTEVLCRVAPLLAPVMHRCNIFTHFFYVPTRLLWDSWQDFITGGEDGLQEPVLPYMATTDWSTLTYDGSLFDYLGVPKSSGSTGESFKINALPFRAYQTIYNEYYRDQNLEDKIPVLKTSGLINGTLEGLLTLRKRCYEKDYFTSALPWTQRGGDVTLPLTGNAPIQLAGDWNSHDQRVQNGSGTFQTNATLGTDSTEGYLEDTVNSAQVWLDPNGSLEADMSSVTASTIEELRRAVKLQRWLEMNARGGSRYIEQILMHFGVRSSDARLQRPEFLGGGRTPLVFSEVLQTSSTDATSPQGEMAGHAIGVGNSHTFKKFFEEHGFVIGIMSVVPKTTYQQGLPKIFRKFDKFDYYWPAFAQLGEQPVYDNELYCDFKETTADDVFGYQSRYCEYKQIPSTVHGDFRSLLDFWHMGRIFGSKPTLNSDFVHVNVDERNFPVQDGSDKLYIQIFNNLKAIRPMPYVNIPTL